MDELLKRSFRPEFLNRLDEIVYFKPLTREDIVKIVDILTANLAKRLTDRQLSLEITQTAKNAIAANSYDAQYGARPLKRYIQAHIETLVAKTIITEELQAGDVIVVDYDKNAETFTAERKK